MAKSLEYNTVPNREHSVLIYISQSEKKINGIPAVHSWIETKYY